MEVMIDLETYGTTPGSVILSIGAVAFDAEGVHGEGFYEVISLQDSLACGFTTSHDTIAWWGEQAVEARRVIEEAQAATAFNCRPVLVGFAEWLNTVPGKPGVWGFGATFDNVLLRKAYEIVGLKCPWHYRQDRCFRTLAALYKVEWPAREGTHHNALDDARYQARVASKIFRGHLAKENA